MAKVETMFTPQCTCGREQDMGRALFQWIKNF